MNCKDIFAKQLLQIPGHTPETCSAIVNLYPTPKSLILAYREWQSQKFQEEMLKDVVVVSKRRKLGKLLSRRTFLFYQPLLLLDAEERK